MSAKQRSRVLRISANSPNQMVRRVSRMAPEVHCIEPAAGYPGNLRIATRDAGILRSQAMRFDCALTLEGWREVADLAEPFRRAVEPDSYQWLNGMVTFRCC